MTLGELIARALASRGQATIVRAVADRRGVALAELCEASEADRDWLPGWDGSRWRVIGTGLIFADGAR